METTIFFNFQERNGNHELVKVLNAIKEGKFKTEIAKLRNTASEEDRRSIKNALPAFTPSVVLNSGRKFNEGDSYNGVIHLDYDKLDDVSDTIEKIKSLEGDGGEGVSEGQRGTWENLGSDFNALSQVYNLKVTYLETELQDEISTFRFTEDFNEFTNDGLTFIRQ